MADNKSRRAKRVLHDLTISEVSAVDRGAAEGARVLLMKRDERITPFERHMREIFGVVQKRQPFNPRMRAPQQKEQPMSRAEALSSVAKEFGITAVCKHICETGPSGISEHELTALIGEHAARNNTSFSKLFASQTEEGTLLRKAIMATRDAQFIEAAGRSSSGSGDAYAELMRKAEKLRAASPELSLSQAFAKIYTDRGMRELAAAERAQNRPVT